MLTDMLQKQDPILDLDLGVSEDVDDPTGACNYKLDPWLEKIPGCLGYIAAFT